MALSGLEGSGRESLKLAPGFVVSLSGRRNKVVFSVEFR